MRGCSFNVIEVGVPMDSLQSAQNDQIHKHDMVALVPEPIPMKARPDEPRIPDDQSVATTMSSQLVDVTAEETCPAPPVQMTAQDGAPQSAVLTAQVPSAKAFELISQLEALANDLAVKGRVSSDQSSGNFHERSDLSGRLPAEEPSIRVSPRSTGFESYQFAIDRPSAGRRKVIALAGFFMVVVIGFGVTFGWRSLGAWTIKQFGDIDIAAGRRGSAPAGQVSISDAALPQSAPVTQTAITPTAPAISPELATQIEAMTQALASVRRGVEELAAQQGNVAAARQQLEQLVAKQEQLAASKRKWPNLAKLQVLAQNAKSRPSPELQFRAIPSRCGCPSNRQHNFLLLRARQRIPYHRYPCLPDLVVTVGRAPWLLE